MRTYKDLETVMKHELARLAAFCLAATFVVSCGSKINQPNFDKIETDMTREEVIGILGEPTDSNDVGIAGFSGGMATWRDDEENTITVQFVNGKVKGKQFAFGGD